jgi:RNA polymerase-binding transcription factor DksA
MNTDEARDRLSAERTRLTSLREDMAGDGQIAVSERESSAELSTLDQHQADVATELFDRERDLSILETVEAELADVEHALRRLDEGSYGTCEACGKPIGEERLEALPATRFCIDDQALADSEARRPTAEEAE